MTTLNDKLREYLRDARNPSIRDFLSEADNVDTTLTFFSQFESMEKAKDSFERKLNALMTQAEHLTERKIRVIKCEKVDWEILYEDARTRREHYLQRIQSRSQAGSTTSEVGSESPTAFAVQCGNLAIEQASLLDLHLVSDLQKVLALSHVLLLTPNSVDLECVKAFVQASIKKVYNEFRHAYFDTSINLGDGILNSLCHIIEELSEAVAAEDDDSDDDARYYAYLKVSDLMKNADREDRVLLRVMNNYISKLPSSETAQVIGETELITNYLDPILSPMFHNPRKGRVFRWLNRTGNETANRRPNGGMAITKQMHGVFETGFVEAKPAEMSTHHTVTHRDTYRLAIFCKDAIDRGEVKCTIGVQAVGFTIDFYLCAAVHDEMYIFMHFSRITVPSSLAALRPFLMHLRGCKQVVAAYNKHCVLRVDNDSMRPEQNRPSLTDDVLADVLHNVNNTKLPTVRFP